MTPTRKKREVWGVFNPGAVFAKLVIYTSRREAEASIKKWPTLALELIRFVEAPIPAPTRKRRGEKR